MQARSDNRQRSPTVGSPLASVIHEAPLAWWILECEVPSDLERWGLSRDPSIHFGRHFLRAGTGSRPRVCVTADGRGVVGHAGARLLADVADVTGLTSRFVEALAVTGRRAGGHEPGRIATDVALMLADGGEAITDISVLRGLPELFGPVASDATVWRALDAIDDARLARLRAARAAARELAWAQLVETRGAPPASKAGGHEAPGLVIDIDASIVVTHSEKEQATPTWKKTFGYHPIFAFCDNTREALAGILRPGRAGSNTAADHITVLDQAIAQLPDAHRYGVDVLVPADTAGCSQAFLAHIRSLRTVGMDTCFCVGVPVTEAVRDAITVASAWTPALQADGDLRDGAEIVEITHLVAAESLAAFPTGTRLIVPVGTPAPRCATRPVRHD